MPSPAIIQAMRQAVAHHQAGRLAEAEAVYRRVLQQDPRDADALQLLGLLHHQTGRSDVAAELISKAITIRPRAEFFVNLSQALKGLGKTREALEACQRAVQMAPNIPEAWNNLGSALREAGRIDEAIGAFNKAISLRPNYVIAHNNLGNALAAMGKGAEAEAALRKAVSLDPNYAEAHSNLGHLLGRMGKLDEGVEHCSQAIQLRPNLVAAYVNLGTGLHLQGRFDEGNAAFERGVQLDPNHAGLQENLITGMNYTTRFMPDQTRDAHVAWSRRFAASRTTTHANAKDPNRKLRAGYVSPDLKRHSVAYFLEPILEHRDRDRFEVFAYSNTDLADEVTVRLRASCDHWRDIRNETDDRAAEMIAADQIDVLIDLAGHTTGNRLGVFARRPAPVQMTYLGYPNTTGLDAIDYRITDELADPIGMTESHYTEKLIRVPAPFICYRPPENSPPVSEPPILRNGFPTFGSFNKAAKVGRETIELWSQVLAAIPSARLVIKSRGVASEGSRRRIRDGFASQQVDPARVQLIEANQSLADHLAMYGQIDIALDTFPYHGTTTTCEAMWMGAAVVTLAGRAHVSRVGVSLLTSVGLTDHIAADPAGFVQIAQSLAADASRLSRLRGELRNRLGASPLCDGARLAKSLEDAYRQAFIAWCTSAA